MDISKIIYFIDVPLGARDYNRYGIEIIEKNGFEVEVWDFTPFLNPEYYRQIQVPDPIERSRGYRIFRERKEVLYAIAGLDNTSFVIRLLVHPYYDLNCLAIFRAMSRAGVKYALLYTNPYPSTGTELTWLGRKIKRIKASKLKDLKRFIADWGIRKFVDIIGYFGGIHPATVAILGTDMCFEIARSRHGPLFGDTTKRLWAHHLDYDIYLGEKEKPAPIDPKMVVFLDDYVPFHPDFIYTGKSRPITAEEYYPQLRCFFDFIEDRYGVHVIIAAHPRSHYEDLPDYYGGRPVIRGQTESLVHRARFVMLNISQSHNYAILFEKPMILLTTDKLLACLGDSYRSLSAWLNKVPVNLDVTMEFDWEKELDVNHKVYTRYKEAYIKKHDTAENYCWQIVADFLKKE